MSKVTREETETEVVEKTVVYEGFECDVCGQQYFEDEGVEEHHIYRDISVPQTAEKEGQFPEDIVDYTSFFAPHETDEVQVLGTDRPIDFVYSYREMTFAEALHWWLRNNGGPSRINYGLDDVVAGFGADDTGARFTITIPVDVSYEAEKTICGYCWEVVFGG